MHFHYFSLTLTICADKKIEKQYFLETLNIAKEDNTSDKNDTCGLEIIAQKKIKLLFMSSDSECCSMIGLQQTQKGPCHTSSLPALASSSRH